MIIFENVSSQRSLEQVATNTIDILEDKLQKELKASKFNPNNLVVNTRDLKLDLPNKGVQTLLDKNINIALRLKQDYSDSGEWSSNMHNDKPSDGTVFLYLDASKVKTIQQIGSAFKMQKRDLTSTIVHEMQHAYDNMRSGSVNDIHAVVDGEETVMSGNKRAYIDKKMRDLASQGKVADYETYMGFSHEVNSRYAQAIMDVKQGGMEMDKPTFIKRFKSFFDGWKYLDNKQQQRVLSRAYQEYEAGNFAPRSAPVTKTQREIQRLSPNSNIVLKDDGKVVLVTDINFKGGKVEALKLLNDLELLSTKIRGNIGFTLDAARKNKVLFEVLREKVSNGDWTRVGSNVVTTPKRG